jgi:two-component system chemotaxis sensor kinase CheA
LSIAEQGTDDNFFEQFLADYFAESEEHLAVLRRGLLALERFVDDARLDTSLLDELFRSFHSLKGISGMVEVREAEQLAHEMESYLRALRHGETLLTQQGVDSLIAGTIMIEQVIAARREQKPPPDIAPVVSQLKSIIPRAAPAAAALSGENNERLWRFEYIPTPELAGRGININTVRARLQDIGKLRNSAPRVAPEGSITFEFIVASQADETAFAALRDYGLTYELLEGPVFAALETDGRKAVPAIAPSNVVRVSLTRLDELMRMVGDLVICRARLEDNLKSAELDMPAPRWRALQETNQMMERQLRDLRDGIIRVRMVPVGEIFERMRFVVRDLSSEYRKSIRLELSGQETEIDKLLIERMMDPLLHLVRNAISHGLESASEREALGKPAEGVVTLRAYTEAETVVIEAEDDGRGIDRERVAEQAQKRGLITASATLDDEALLDLICSPGFSTREEADRASGRGVGMAVVKSTVLGLGGAFSLDTEAGRGTRFKIQLPITLAIAEALIVSAGSHRFAVPQSSVCEVIEVEPASIKRFEKNEIIYYRGGALPILRLARMFGLDEERERAFHAFVVGSGSSAVAIGVSRIIEQREIVVRAINDPLIQVAGIAGATELGDGRVVLILDASALASRRAEN